MQLIVFDNSGGVITHLVNCNVGGLPLKWNRTSSFDHYPVSAHGLREPEYKLALEEIQSYIEPTIDIRQLLKSHEYVYLIIYTRAFHVMAGSFYKNINRHAEKYASKSIKHIYVNAEDLYVELDKKSTKSLEILQESRM